MCCCLQLHCHINTWYQSQMKHPWCRYSKNPVDSEHEETLYQVLLCTLIIFLFIHLPLHNMLVRFAMIPAFPPLFVFIFHTSHFRTPLHTIFASFSLYFHFFLTVCNASYLISPHFIHPPQCFLFHLNTQENLFFPVTRWQWNIYPLQRCLPPEVPLKLSFKGLCTSSLYSFMFPLNDNN